MSIEINQLRNNSVSQLPIQKKPKPKNLEQLIKISRQAWALDAAKQKSVHIKKLDAKDIIAVERDRKRCTQFIKASKEERIALTKKWKEEDRINGL